MATILWSILNYFLNIIKKNLFYVEMLFILLQSNQTKQSNQRQLTVIRQITIKNNIYKNICVIESSIIFCSKKCHARVSGVLDNSSDLQDVRGSTYKYLDCGDLSGILSKQTCLNLQTRFRSMDLQGFGSLQPRQRYFKDPSDPFSPSFLPGFFSDSSRILQIFSLFKFIYPAFFPVPFKILPRSYSNFVHFC